MSSKVLADKLGVSRRRRPTVQPPLSSSVVFRAPSVERQNAISQAELSTSRSRRLGTCSSCLRQLSLTSSGSIHSHGPHDKPCPGSGCTPAASSVTMFGHASSSSSSTVGHGIDSQPDDASSVQLTVHQQTELLLQVLNKARCRPVLKYIPKASRFLAASKLSTLLDRVVTNPDNIVAWEQLLLFTHSCFGSPGRAGQKKNLKSSLATKVNRALSDYLTVGHIQPLGGVGLFDKKGIWKKDTSSDDLKTLAARVSAKIEEGDVRGAVRIASSNDKLAPFDDNVSTS